MITSLSALSAHEKLYALGSHEIKNRTRPQSNLDGDNNINSFDSVMLRIQHFSQTSQRLGSLTAYVLSSLEEELQQAPEKYRNSLNDDEEHAINDDTIFRQKLAWNAIWKRVNK